MSFPNDYVHPNRYPSLTDDELIAVLCQLTEDLVTLRWDFSQLAAQHSAQFFRVFMDAQETTVSARNRLAEAATVQLDGEKLQCEVNIAATEDLCALVRTILDQRR